MIIVEITDGKHSLGQFQADEMPSVGDVLSIIKAQDAVECYTVTGRAFAIVDAPGVDQLVLSYGTVKVRKSTPAEEASFR
jgi:hypothetical protein